MKFTDGFWHTRPGVDAQYAAEAYDIETKDDADGGRLVVLAPTRVVTGRGDALVRFDKEYRERQRLGGVEGGGRAYQLHV